MTFFNKKEDVIQIELTPYGRRKLAEGKLKPSYYAFYDDDIIYDSKYAGFSEAPISASQRIKESVRTKVQNYYKGVESNKQQIPDQKVEYVLNNQLGTSDPKTNFYPSWKINSYLGEFSSTSRVLENTASYSTQQIPQMDVKDLRYVNKKIDKSDDSSMIFGYIFEDDTAITLDSADGHFLSSIVEENSEFLKDKFDVEVYEIVESGSAEIEVPLKFRKLPKQVQNNILLSPEEMEEQMKDFVLTDEHVEYYFYLDVDSEIEEEILKEVLRGESLQGSSGLESMQSAQQFGNENTYASSLIEGVTMNVGGVGDDLDGLSPDEIARLSQKNLVQKYINDKTDQLNSNQLLGIEPSNKSGQTNIYSTTNPDPTDPDEDEDCNG